MKNFSVETIDNLFFDILKIEKTKELLATSKFCTFELIEKSILLKRLS